MFFHINLIFTSDVAVSAKFADVPTMAAGGDERPLPPWPFTGKTGRLGDSGSRGRESPEQRTHFCILVVSIAN